jgi:TonB family protein
VEKVVAGLRKKRGKSRQERMFAPEGDDERKRDGEFLTFSCEGILSAFGIETGLDPRDNAGGAKVMTLRKTLLYTLGRVFLIVITANPSSGPDEKKQEKTKEEKELIAACKTKLIKKDGPPEPKDWKWGKDGRYRGGPTISYTIEADGNVTNVKLKRSSGVRKIDEYELASVKRQKFKPMPGCPGVETTETIIIDFQ